MPFNVVGDSDAVEALSHEMEVLHDRNPGYPWWLELTEEDGPFIDGGGDELTADVHQEGVEAVEAAPEGHPRRRRRPQG